MNLAHSPTLRNLFPILNTFLLLSAETRLSPAGYFFFYTLEREEKAASIIRNRGVESAFGKFQTFPEE